MCGGDGCKGEEKENRKWRWMDSIKDDLTENGLRPRQLVSNINHSLNQVAGSHYTACLPVGGEINFALSFSLFSTSFGKF